MNKIAVFLVFCVVAVASAGYDPLAVDKDFSPSVLDLVVNDAGRGREIPILIYLPAQKEACPVVVFSHGLGGSRFGCKYLGVHWASRGYAAVFVQHPGSDAEVWKDVPRAERMAAMKRAADAENFMLRVKDIPAVLDELEKWNKSPDHRLAGRLDMDRVGMSGHSFGAVTTQAVSGQSFVTGKTSLTDPRIKAAAALSPSAPRSGEPEQAFGSVKIPWLLMTGTEDISPIGDVDVASRLAVFPALPEGSKYELVLDGAKHSAFSDNPLPRMTGRRNPNHHRAILALSTAFWDACLRTDKAAKAWLDGKGAQSVLEPGDRWQLSVSNKQ